MRLLKAVESTWDSAEDILAELDSADQLLVHLGSSLLGVYRGLEAMGSSERVLQLQRQVVAAELALARLHAQTGGARAGMGRLLASLGYPWLREEAEVMEEVG